MEKLEKLNRNFPEKSLHKISSVLRYFREYCRNVTNVLQ